MPDLSTTKAVECIINHILNGLEDKFITCVTLIDLTKAFDCVTHKVLFKKLHFYGLKSILIRPYLCSRKHMVCQKNDKSEFQIIKSGVRGSVLGPFLFLIAMNNFPSNMLCKSILYADDTILVQTGKDLKKN